MKRQIKTWSGAVRHIRKNYSGVFNTPEKEGWNTEEGKKWFSYCENYAEYDPSEYRKTLKFIENGTYLPGCPFEK